MKEGIAKLKDALASAKCILIGAGAGLSAAAGYDYAGARFLKYFSDFHERFGIEDIYSGGFYPFPSREIFWAWWSRSIYINLMRTGSRIARDGGCSSSSSESV